MPKTPIIAKISAPEISGIYHRKRLSRLFDEAKKYPITWLSAPGGSGKTTAVADYITREKLPCLWYRMDEGDCDLAGFFYYMGLAVKKANPKKRKAMPLFTPEYLMGSAVFSRRYFEEVGRRLPSNACLIFDDYQVIPESSPFHNVLNEGLKVLSGIVRVIIISRTAPLEAWSRFAASDHLKLVRWEDIRVTEEEASGILGRKEESDNKAHIDKLLERGDGWIAGLLLLDRAGAMDGGSGITGSDELFNYFAYEVFNRADERMKTILLRTAFVSSFSSKMADALAGKGSSRFGISQMAKENFFIEVHGASKKQYRYHPLFREFLLSTAEEAFSEDEINRLRELSADLLASEGRFDEAAELLVKNEAWTNLSVIVLSHAQELFVQGRLLLLKKWIDHLPEVMKADQPWLSYWEGMCLLPFDQTAARDSLSRAFSRFVILKDEAAFIASWSAIIETFIIDWSRIKRIDKWLKIFREEIEPVLETQEEDIKIGAISAYLYALSWRSPLGDEVRRWMDIADNLIYRISSPSNLVKLAGALMPCLTYVEGLHKASPLSLYMENKIQGEDINPVLMLQYYAMEGMYKTYGQQSGSVLDSYDAFLILAEETGLHVFDPILLAYYIHNVVGIGNTKELNSARESLEKQPAPRPIDKGQADYSMGTLLLALDDVKGAEAHIENCFNIIKKTGSAIATGLVFLALGTVKYRAGKYDESLAWFVSGRRLAGGANVVSFHALLYEGLIHFEKGEKEAGLTMLKDGLEIGAKERYLMIAYFDRIAMDRIFSLAIEENIGGEYAAEFIRRNSLLPVGNIAALKDWPWPVKVYTLGRFEIELDGKPLEEGRKSHHRILDVLKVIICLGGNNVPAYRIADALWPEKEGDAAQSALDMGIHRLRKLLGHRGAVEVKHGEVSINRKRCWVDAFSFLERASCDVDGKGKGIVTKVSEMENLLSLYGGELLPAHADSLWVIPMRKKLKDFYLTALERLGNARETSEEWTHALVCYSSGVEGNPLAEEHVRGLMRSFAALGRRVEAVSAYRKFEDDLKNNIGINPSSDTKALFKEISASS